MSTFTSTVGFVVETCCHKGCGVTFALNRDHYNRLQAEKGSSFYCPNGHGQHYTGKSDEQKLREAAARETALRDQLSAAIREGEVTKAALLRDRARFAAGICPCCTRSFDNVRRHMSSQHPDYDVKKIAVPVAVFGCSCGRKFSTLRGLRVHQGHSRANSPYAWDNPKTSKWYSHLTDVKV